MKQFLLTRPIDSCQTMKPKLNDMGFECIINPLLKITYPKIKLNFTDYDAIIITSMRAIKALPKNTNAPIFCVGETTADKCRLQGYKVIIAADNVLQLIIKISSITDKMHLLYLRGSNISKNLAYFIQPHTLKEEVCYYNKNVTSFKSDVAQALKSGTIRQTAIFSTQSATNFIQAVKNSNDFTILQKMHCIAYSDKIATMLKNYPFNSIRVCKNPSIYAFWQELSEI